MSITTDLRKTVTGSKPLSAAVGVVDATVGRLREVPATLSTLKIDVDEIRSALSTMRTQTAELPDRAQAAAQSAAAAATKQAQSAYDELATRGRSLVRRITDQQATKDLEAQRKAAVARTKAAATTARKSAARAGASAQATAKTVEDGAAATRAAVKGAATSARRTASAAAKAAEDATDKVG